MSRPLFIAVPAFGPRYVEIARRFTIPAARAALRERQGGEAAFLIHTDNREAFTDICAGHRTEFFPAAHEKGKDPFPLFVRCHKEAMAFAPHNSILALFNADIVVSRETFRVVDELLVNGKKVIAVAAVRANIDISSPPIGASANALAQWTWHNRHPITENNVFGRGHSRLPAQIFFDEGNDVAMHCFHLCPMFLLKDRKWEFAGTIDDDVIAGYEPQELIYLTERQAAFAELSPADKKQPVGGSPMTAETVADAARRWKPSHIENFKQRYAILGRPRADHPAIAEILAGIARGRPLIKVTPQMIAEGVEILRKSGFHHGPVPGEVLVQRILDSALRHA